MQFQAEHRFHGTPGAVCDLLADPTFYVDLELPDLSRPEVLEHRKARDDAVLRLRYEFVGSLDPIAQRLLGSNRLAWIQEMHVNARAGSGKLTFGAERDPKRLHGAADFVLTEDGGGVGGSADGHRGGGGGDGAGRTVRRLDGELVVAVPAIGHMAERRIVPGLLRRMDIEAQALDDRLRGGG